MARMKSGVFSWEDVLAQRYQNDKPTALSSRPRRQTPPADPDHDSADEEMEEPTVSERAEQSQSSLLAKLSPELRMLIWEKVLGGMRIHVIQRSNRRMGHVICSNTEACEICQGGRPQPSRKNRPDLLLALSLTCQQVYCESIHLLYTLNIFEFSNTWSLTYLRPTIPDDLWDSIRDVELRWAFPGHWLPTKDPVKTVYFSAGRQQWIETCKALTRMKNLRSFTLQLSGSWFCEPVEKIPVFLEPLRDLKLKQGWKLQLPQQPYYAKEIQTIDGDLRKRGIACLIRAA